MSSDVAQKRISGKSLAVNRGICEPRIVEKAKYISGPNAGDVCVWHAEGYNYDHEDSLSTTWGGKNETSVSPIFIGVGKGFKEGYRTDRIIRQIDFAATVAVLGGVRMPRNCERV